MSSSKQSRDLKPVERFVCYIDLLGFSDYVKSIADNDAELEKTAKFLQDLQTRFIESYPSLNATSLSDSIFIYTNDSTDESCSSLLLSCLDISDFLFKSGYLPRGGISFGPCAVNGTIAVGEPIVRAVRLENSVAIYPRIVFGRNFVQRLQKHSDNELIEASKRRADDGPFFLATFSNRAQKLAAANLRLRDLEKIEIKVQPQDEEIAATKRDINLHLKEINGISRLISAGLDTHQEDSKVYKNYAWMKLEFERSFQPLEKTFGDRLIMPKT